MAGVDFPVFSTDEFMPHGMCYLWRPGILALHIASDLLITLAYLSIPFTLIYFVGKRRDLQFDWIFVCFAVFIVACGVTHLMEIWVIWHPDYWASGMVKAITALASVLTAILLIRLVPAALAVPSPAELRSAYSKLETEAAEHRKTGERLRVVNEQLLQEEVRARLAAIVDSSDDAIISKSTAGTIASWNHGAEKMFGYSAAEAIGRPMTFLYPPELVPGEIDILARITRGEQIESFETIRVRKDGERVDVSVTISPIKSADGAIAGASTIARDITDRRRADESLMEQAKILDLGQVMVRDTDGRILRWSRGAENLYGYTREEAVGRVSHELLGTLFPDTLANINAQLERTGTWEGELTHRKRDGELIHVASIWALHRDTHSGRTRILESNNDVTDRRRAEHKLAEQLSRLQLLNGITRAIGERQDLSSISQVVIKTLIDQLPIDFGCLLLQQESNALAVAQMAAKNPGLSIDLDLTEHPSIEIDENGLSPCVRGELIYESDMNSVPFPFSKKLAAGGLRSMVVAPLRNADKFIGALLVARLGARSFSSGECEFLSQLSEHVALATNQSQLYAALEAAYQDQKRTQQAVVRQEKLRVLGQMASGIAHDINNALSPAAVYIELLLERESVTTGESREYLEITRRAIESIAQTVARMKDFYSTHEPLEARAAVQVNETIQRVIDLTRARWTAMAEETGVVIRVDTDFAPDLPILAGDEGEIRDALMNLILNAVDAMPRGGRLTLRTRALEADRIQIEVMDTGVGMDAATRSKCLELFFTTKGTRGTGLGLPMVYGTVERHGGELHIDSEPGAGTTVRLIFPSGPPPVPQSAGASAPLRHRPLRILVIDDDPVILKALVATLGQDGHTVAAVDGGQRGIDTFRDANEGNRPFQAVVTDLGMPNVDGRTVAAAIKALRPDVPVILLTGWGHRLLADHDTPSSVDRVLGKPPKLAELRRALAELTGIPRQK